MGAGPIIYFIVLLVAGIFFYFIPAIVANNRHHPQVGAITVLNFLLGWTLIGWVGALVWAMTNSDTQEPLSGAEPASASKKCPYCAEEVRAEAIKCKHCGSDLAPVVTQR